MDELKLESKSKTGWIASYEFILLSSVVILGFFLRFYYLSFYLSSGSTDSVGYSYTALLYSQGNWLSANATPKGFLLVCIMALFTKILGPTLLAGQLVSFLSGGLLPIIIFFLGAELFNKKTGLLSALIVSLNPLLILYSCLIFREMLFSLTLFCCFYFALRGFKGSALYSILAGIFFALSSMTIEVGLFTGIGFIVYFFVQKTIKNKGRLGELKNLDLFFCSAFLTMIPLFIRDYLLTGDPFFSWTTFGYFTTAILIYIIFIGLSIPYVIVFRILFPQAKIPSIDRFSKVIKVSSVGLISLVIILVLGYFSGLYSGTLGLLSAQSFTGFVKFGEYMALPESLGIFLILFSIGGIVYGLKSRDKRALVIFSLIVFVFSYAVRAAVLSQSYRFWENASVIDLLTWGGGLQRVTWPFEFVFRYPTPFYPLFLIFAGYGIFLLCDRLPEKLNKNSTNGLTIQENEFPRKSKRIVKKQVFKIGLVSIMIFVIVFAYVHAQDDLFARADSHDAYKNPRLPANAAASWWYSEGGQGTSLIDWLSSQGSPVVYSYNRMFKKQYGEDRVILLNGNENLLDIVNKARKDGVEYIISDVWGTYSSTQYELFLAGYRGRTPRLAGQSIGYYELVRSYTRWHMAQVFKISLPQKIALLVQGTATTGSEWVYFLSNTSSAYMVQVVDDDEQLAQYLNIDYDVIVLAEIQRQLESDELSLLREKVEGGTTLIMNGISPAYLDLEENSDWLGAKNFVEAPREAKWDIAFTADAIDVLSEIKLDKNYSLFSQSPYSSPTGLTNISSDVTVYATRVEDGTVAIMSKSYYNGLVVFSGVRHYYAAKAVDYNIYINFVENLLGKSK